MNQNQTIPFGENVQKKQRMPKYLFKILNPVMKFILNSPLHGGISKNVMVLSFTGNKSGKLISTPVAYLRDRDRVIVVTYSSWRVNFKQPAPVQMRIQGKTVSGTAVLVTNPEQAKQILQTLTRTNGKEMMQRMDLWIEDLDTLSPEAVQQVTRGVYFIEVNTQAV
jgi:hypothetical protein